MKSDAWIAGYNFAREAPSETLAAIEPPADFTDEQKSDFVSGALIGFRDAYNDRLIDSFTL